MVLLNKANYGLIIIRPTLPYNRFIINAFLEMMLIFLQFYSLISASRVVIWRSPLIFLQFYSLISASVVIWHSPLRPEMNDNLLLNKNI